MSQAENREAQQGLQMRRIEVLNSSINFLGQDKNSIYNYDINIEHQIDYTNKYIFVFVSVYVKSEDQKELIGSAVVNCIFSISDFEEVIKADAAGKYQVPQLLAASLSSISVATVRGFMFATFKGTFMHNAILPIIDLENTQTATAVE
jgi:hypothetical protein